MTKQNAPLTLLLLIFITLKLCHVIAWSWWWVFSPVWIPVMVIGVVAMVGIDVMTVKNRSKNA